MVRSTLMSAISAIALVGAMSPAAQAQIFKAPLTGGAEIPPVASTGSGTVVVALNTTTNEMKIRSSFTGLVSNTSVAHIHCCVAQPGNAGVATTTPSFVGFPAGVRSGTFVATFNMLQAGTWNPAFITANGGTPASAQAAFVAGVNAGRSYFNVHSVMFPAGEIRGNLVRFTFAGNSGLSARTTGAAAALDSLGAGTGELTDTLLALAFLTPEQQVAALETVSPATSRGVQVATLENMHAVFDQVGDRLDGLRLPQSDAALGAWVKGYGSNNRQDDEDGFAGYSGDGWGIALGMDHDWSDSLIVGAALSYGRQTLRHEDQRAGGKNNVESTQISVYASQELGDFYLDYMAAYANQSVSETRASASGAAFGDFDGDQFGVRVGGGLPLAVSSGLTLTPQASLEWARLELDGYTETGGGSLALAVESRSADMLSSSVGAELAFDTAMGGMSTRPFVRAHWVHSFENDGMDAAAAFVAGGDRFVTPGQPLEENSYVVGAGITVLGGETFSAGLAYDATLSETYQSHVVQARARWVF